MLREWRGGGHEGVSNNIHVMTVSNPFRFAVIAIPFRPIGPFIFLAVSIFLWLMWDGAIWRFAAV